MKRYYITDRHSCPVDLLACIEANARIGVEWVQIREKDLGPRDLLVLARAALVRVAAYGTRVLLNGRLDVALAAGLDGVHLPASGPPAAALRRIVPAGFLIAVSTHTLHEVRRAEREGADLAVFGPVFPTRSKPGRTEVPGLDGLRTACHSATMPVAALGGVTPENTSLCAAAGAAAVAGIRMFQSSTVSRSTDTLGNNP